MKAIVATRPGGSEVLEWAEVPDPAPGEGEVLVEIEAAGVNFIDVYLRQGLYPTRFPHTVGSEAAGTVTAVGPDVGHLTVGDRVAYAGVSGAYAERAVAPAERLVEVPAAVPMQTAAAAMLQGMTAHYLTHDSYPLGEGSRCLIHAGAGGVGLLFIQMAKMRGATVIATVSTEEKTELARQAGADQVVVYTAVDFVEEVEKEFGDRPLDVVYDSVGRTTFLRGFDLLRPRGVMVLFGQASGPAEPIDPQLLNEKGSLFLTRPSLRHHVAGRDELVRRARDLFSWIEGGRLQVRVGATFPMAEARAAHDALEGRATTGKVLLVP